MKVAMMQPTFLPWMGYFELIAKADKFIFLDDFQFVYRSYHQRNRLFVNRDIVNWVGINVSKKESYKKPLNETVIREDLPWRNKLWRCIEDNYKKTPFFEQYADKIKPLIITRQANLASQNMSIIITCSNILGFYCEFLRSSELNTIGVRSAKIRNILNSVGADIYLSANGSFGYMYEDKVFPCEGVEVKFQNVLLKPYEQKGSSQGFVPYLSILDALFNIGAEGTKQMILELTGHWMSWKEMKALYESEKTHGK